MLTHSKINLNKYIPAKRKNGKATTKPVTIHFIKATCARDISEFIESNHPDKSASNAMNAHFNDEKWDFSAGFAGISELCKTGWNTGTQSVCDFSDKIRENYKKNSSYSRDTTGLFFDVSDVIAGVPECYFKKNETRQTKEIQLNISIAGDFKCPASMLHNRGAAILALVQTLQSEQWRVKISLFCALFEYPKNGNEKNPGYTIARIDLDTKPLDVSELALILAHPGFLRRMILATAETVEGCSNLGGYGNGTLKDTDNRLSGFIGNERRSMLNDVIPVCNNSLNFLEYINNQDQSFDSPASAAEWVKNQIESI